MVFIGPVTQEEVPGQDLQKGVGRGYLTEGTKVVKPVAEECV